MPLPEVQLSGQWHRPYRRTVPRQPKNFAIETVVHVTPAQRWVPIRTGPTTYVPSRFTARLLLAEPKLVVDVDVVVGTGGQARLQELAVIADQAGAVPISSSTLRRILVDQVLRAVLTAASRSDATDRPDLRPGAFQLPGDEEEAWVEGKGTPQVRRAAQIYISARASGSRAPTEAVATEMNVSRSQASRYVRAARDAELLPEADDSPYVTPGAAIAAKTMADMTRKFAETGKLPGDSEEKQEGER